MSNPAYQITGNDIETSKGIRLILSHKVKKILEVEKIVNSSSFSNMVDSYRSKFESMSLFETGAFFTFLGI